MNKAVFFGIFFFLCYFFSIFFFCFCFFLFFFIFFCYFFFSSRRRHTRSLCDWSQTCALPICQKMSSGLEASPPAVMLSPEATIFNVSPASNFARAELRNCRCADWTGQRAAGTNE